MKIVVDIPDEVYDRLKTLNSHGMATGATMYILNGTPLPKGHGDLIDRDELANDDRICEGISCSDCPFENFRLHTCRMCNFVKSYPVIIEADAENGIRRAGRYSIPLIN